MLKSCFAIISSPSHNWQMGIMKNIILTCIILHNIIIENERDAYNGNIDVDYDHIDKDILNVDVSHDAHLEFAKYLKQDVNTDKRSSPTTSSSIGEACLRMFR